MSKYRKKPVEVEAKQWFKDGDHEAVNPMTNTDYKNIGCIENYDGISIRVHPSDWIITDSQSDHSTCRADIFKATYEKVEEKEKTWDGQMCKDGVEALKNYRKRKYNKVGEPTYKKEPEGKEEDNTLVTQDDLNTLFNLNKTDAEKEKQTKAMDKIFKEARDAVDKLSVDFQGKIDIPDSECKICKGSKLVCNLCGVGVVDSKSVVHLCKSKDMLLTRHAVQCPECREND